MPRLLPLLALLLLTACAAPVYEAAEPVMEPAVVAMEPEIPACKPGDDGIGGTGCTVN